MFRNIRSVIPSEDQVTKLFDVHEDKIVETDHFKVLPCSNDYSLKDMLAAGVKIVPVDPTILHDNTLTSALANDFVDNYVEPSNSDEK